MTLKYVGPKPIISHSGIEFDKNKEDKFIYLNIVVQLIQALDHKYIEGKSYIYQDIRLSDIEMLHILKKYCQNMDSLLDKTAYSIEDEIEHNIQRAYESDTLEEEDKEVLVKNITLMHDYMLQRAVNKSVYYCAMAVLADIAQRDHIEHITTPMYQPFMHVLHSLQGTLLKEKVPIDTQLDVFEQDKQLFVKLKVINILKK